MVLENILFATEKQKSAVDIVIDSIKKLLIMQQIKPGDRLPNETALSEQLNVSRGSIREAFKILSAYGIVEIKRGDGTYVSSGANQNMFSPVLFQILVKNQNCDALVEVRRMLEEGILGLCIVHATQEDYQEIHNINAALKTELQESTSEVTLRAKQLDIAFHKALACATHNDILTALYDFVMELLEVSMNPVKKNAWEEHQNILDALVEKDLSTAEQHLKTHIQSWFI